MQEDFKKNYKNIGKRLSVFRKHQNISQNNLAQLLGLSSYTSISKVERGERALTIDMILKLESNFEDLDLHWLITGEKSPEHIKTQKQLIQIIGMNLSSNTEARDFIQELLNTAESILSSGEIKGVLKTQYLQYIDQLQSIKQITEKQIDKAGKSLTKTLPQPLPTSAD